MDSTSKTTVERFTAPLTRSEATMRTGTRRSSISVIIPTYNRAGLVVEAINSVLAQTRPADEIIVVDDGSTDDTDAVLSQFERSVSVVRQPNGGLSAARNRGLAAATGDIVLFLDSDDLLMPTCIEHVLESMEAHPEVDVVHSDCYMIDQRGNRLGVYSDLHRGEHPSGMILGALGHSWFLINISSAAVRRSALRGIEFDVWLAPNASGRPVVGFAEDFEFWRELAPRSRFLYLDEKLACYRYHDSQVTTSEVKTIEGALEVQRRIMEMPEFEQVSRRDKAKLYCSHGARHASLDRGSVARSMFWRAVRTSPTYLAGYVLLALSMAGNRAVQYAIRKRRQFKGLEVNSPAGTSSSAPQLQSSLQG